MAVLIIFAKYDVVDFFVFFVNKICDRKLNKNASTAKNDTKEWACYYSKKCFAHDDYGRHECVNVITFCCISRIHLNLLLLSDGFDSWAKHLSN